jgi:tetrahydromethanopterin S-methyltransferase subunit G
MPFPEEEVLLDPHGMFLLMRRDAAFHRWQQCIGDETTRWREIREAENELYDHLCLLDDMWDVAYDLGVRLNIEKLRMWRRIVNRRIATVNAESVQRGWTRNARDHGHVYSDVVGTLQNVLRPLYGKTVSRENCKDY